jgi:hypothetical protein
MSSHAQNPSDTFIWWIGWWTMSFHVMSASLGLWYSEQNTMENKPHNYRKHHISIGKSPDFDWENSLFRLGHGFNSYVALTKKVLWPRPRSFNTINVSSISVKKAQAQGGPGDQDPRAQGSGWTVHLANRANLGWQVEYFKFLLEVGMRWMITW